MRADVETQCIHEISANLADRSMPRFDVRRGLLPKANDSRVNVGVWVDAMESCSRLASLQQVCPTTFRGTCDT